ncbi:MAG: hypothetical protein KJZ96_08890 [Rhodocyclaceae bacterium]|nr:hypothetical protein [Rhodocyclaceae bacterium]
MEVNRALLKEASEQGVIDVAQAEALWHFLSERAQDTASFRFTHVLYYLGGMLAIGAMSLFMTLGWEAFGGSGLFAITLAYGMGGLWLTEHLLRRRALPVPAGITATFVIVLVPLAVYGLQSALGLWPERMAYRDYHRLIDWRWLLMELATLGVAAALLWRYRLPFLVMPVAVTLWYIGMDIVPFLFDGDRSWELRKLVSLHFGLLFVGLAFWVDLRSRHGQDFAWWLYLFGVLTFWGGLSLMRSDSELAKFGYFGINLTMIFIGAILSRRVFAVFGALGAAGYLGYLAHSVFRDSMLFPFVLTAIGLGIIYLGIVWQRNEKDFGNRLREKLPRPLRELIEARR